MTHKFTYKVGIIGGGNLGTAIAKGLLKSGFCKPAELVMTEKRESRSQYLKENGFNVIDETTEAVSKSEYVIFSVKPQHFESVLQEIKPSLHKSHTILYTVTGISMATVEKAIGKLPIFRIMPNTAIEICESMTCLSFVNAKKEQEKAVMAMMDKMGKTIIIGEDLMPAATVLGACGIAFALRFMRAATQGGIEIGFGSEMSQLITAQTIKGATQLILENGEHPEQEIDKVTTPQGITISGLNEMEHQGFSSALIKGLLASYNKLMGFKK